MSNIHVYADYFFFFEAGWGGGPVLAPGLVAHRELIAPLSFPEIIFKPIKHVSDILKIGM